MQGFHRPEREMVYYLAKQQENGSFWAALKSDDKCIDAWRWCSLAYKELLKHFIALNEDYKQKYRQPQSWDQLKGRAPILQKYIQIYDKFFNMYEESLIIQTIDGWFDANYNNYNVDKMNESYNTGIQRRAARIKAARKKAKMLRKILEKK